VDACNAPLTLHSGLGHFSSLFLILLYNKLTILSYRPSVTPILRCYFSRISHPFSEVQFTFLEFSTLRYEGQPNPLQWLRLHQENSHATETQYSDYSARELPSQL